MISASDTTSISRHRDRNTIHIMTPIRVGIIGYGFAAKSFHIPFISAISAYKIVAILQRAEAPTDPSTVAAGSHCTVDHPDVKHYRTPDDFFSDSTIDLVVVATHHDTHALFAEKALLAGKHGMRESYVLANAAGLTNHSSC